MRVKKTTFKTATKTSRKMTSEFAGSHAHFLMSERQTQAIEALQSADALHEDLRIEFIGVSSKRPTNGLFAVYILVFLNALGERVRYEHAQGYIGSTNWLPRRFKSHVDKDGSNITRAAIASGLQLKIGAIFFSDNRLNLEFALKERKRCNDFLFETARPRKRGASLESIHRAVKLNKERAPVVVQRKMRARKEREEKRRRYKANQALDEAS